MKKDEFEQNMTQLLNLLKKILKSQPSASPFNMKNMFDQKNSDPITLNLCFFNFIPVTPEEMDEIEDAANGLFDQDDEDVQDVFNWNDGDIDFLKKHGIQF